MPSIIHEDENKQTETMNNVNIIGRLGGDVELRYTPKGIAVAEITIAVDDGWGENKKTAWVGVTIWGATAELASRALSKGSRVAIQGRLSQDEWEDKTTGKKQRKTRVTCENMTLIEPKRDGQQPRRASEQDQMPPGRQQQPTMPPAPPETPDSGEDDDIPF